MDQDFWHDFVAGWVGGCVGLIAGHPLDTIKVRQQVLGNLGIVRCLVNTFKFEGVHGFYKGLGFPLLATGTLNSLFFGVYGNSLRILKGEKERPSYSNIFWAGCAGGIVQLVVATPVELIKIKLQMQVGDQGKLSSAKVVNNYYKGPTACLKDLYKKQGIRGWYQGLTIFAIRDIPSFGLYMMIYEAFIRGIAGREEDASALALVFCGGMAGALSWVPIVPIDVVKSRIQNDNPMKPQYKGMKDCIVQSYRNEGMAVFSRGFVMVTLRALPTNGAIFLGYVSCLNLFRKYSGANSNNNNNDNNE